MVSRSMTYRRIWVGSTPGEDGSAINDEIACPEQLTVQGDQHAEHNKCFWQRSSSALSTFALLRRTGNAGTTVLAHRQATGQRKSRPVAQPIMYILEGESPQCAQEGHEQQRLLTVGLRCTSGTCR